MINTLVSNDVRLINQMIDELNLKLDELNAVTVSSNSEDSLVRARGSTSYVANSPIQANQSVIVPWATYPDQTPPLKQIKSLIAAKSHVRLHDMDSSLDHAAATGDDKGKFVRAHSASGTIMFRDILLNDLVDVDAATPDDDDVLMYSETMSAWTTAAVLTNFELDSTPPNHDYSGLYTQMTIHSAASTAFGTPLYVASDGQLDVADADSDTTMPAMFLATGSAVGTATVMMISPGTFVQDTSWNWTVGGTNGVIYVSTSGTLTQTRPSGNDDIVQPVGVALTADVAFFCAMAFVKVSA